MHSTKKRLTKKRKAELIDEFKAKCKETEQIMKKIKNKTDCTMYSFGNVWWLFVRASPCECLEASVS